MVTKWESDRLYEAELAETVRRMKNPCKEIELDKVINKKIEQNYRDYKNEYYQHIKMPVGTSAPRPTRIPERTTRRTVNSGGRVSPGLAERLNAI